MTMKWRVTKKRVFGWCDVGVRAGDALQLVVERCGVPYTLQQQWTVQEDGTRLRVVVEPCSPKWTDRVPYLVHCQILRTDGAAATLLDDVRREALGVWMIAPSVEWVGSAAGRRMLEASVAEAWL